MTSHVCRHRLEARGNYDVVVGWDPPLSTYFAQVAEGARVGEVDSFDLKVWAGTDYGEIKTEQLKAVITPFAEMSQDVASHLAERKVERPVEKSILDQLRGRIDRNEDGMIWIPWFKDRNGPYVVQIITAPGIEPQYLSAAGMHDQGPVIDKITEAAEFDRKGDAKYFAHILGQHIDGEIVILPESHAKWHNEVRQSRKDMQTVVNLASEIEDRSPEEQQALDRLTESLEENPPPRVPDPNDGWLNMFESETREREQSKGRDDQERGV
jgi:hypothetical protein